MHKVFLFAKFKLINFSEGETCSHEKKKILLRKIQLNYSSSKYHMPLHFSVFHDIHCSPLSGYMETSSIFSDQSSLFSKYSYKEIQ